MLQGFADDLDSLFANLTTNGSSAPTPAIQHPALAADDAIVMTSSQPIAAQTTLNSTCSIGVSNCEKVKEQTRKVFEKQLAPTITTSVSKVLNDYISRPYQSVWEDYVDKSQLEAQLFSERVEAMSKACMLDY